MICQHLEEYYYQKFRKEGNNISGIGFDLEKIGESLYEKNEPEPLTQIEITQQETLRQIEENKKRRKIFIFGIVGLFAVLMFSAVATPTFEHGQFWSRLDDTVVLTNSSNNPIGLVLSECFIFTL